MNKRILTSSLLLAGFALTSCGGGTPTYSISFVDNTDVTFALIDNTTSKAEAGETVSFTATGNNSEVIIESVNVYTTGDSTLVNVNNTDGVYSFVMPEKDVSIRATSSIKEYIISYNLQDVFRVNMLNKSTYTAKANESVSFSIATLNSEEELTGLTIKKADSSVVSYEKVDSTYTFVMPAGNVNIELTSQTKEYAINVTQNSHVNMNIKVNKAKKGEQVSFVANPDSGYVIKKVAVESNGNEISTTENDATYTFIMPGSPVNISFETDVRTYSVSFANPTDYDYEFVGKTGNFVYRDDVEFVIRPHSGKSIKSVSASTPRGSTIQLTTYNVENGTFKFSMPKEDVTVYVVTESAYRTITFHPQNANCSMNFIGKDSNFLAGDEVWFHVSPTYGYKVTNVVVYANEGVEGITLTSENYSTGNFKFIMPDRDVTIVVSTVARHTITTQADEHSSITINSSNDYFDQGNTVTFTVSADQGYEITTVEVKNGNNIVATTNNSNTYTFVMPDANVTIFTTSQALQIEGGASDPFTSPMSFEGMFYDRYYGDTIRVRVVFDGNGKLSWYVTAVSNDYDWAMPKRSKPSNMLGTEYDSQENATYTFDGATNQIKFISNFRQTEMTLNVIKSGDTVTGIQFVNDLKPGNSYFETAGLHLAKL